MSFFGYAILGLAIKWVIVLLLFRFVILKIIINFKNVWKA